MAQVLQKKKLISDVLKWEANYRFNRGGLTITAGQTEIEVEAGDYFDSATGTKFTGNLGTTPAEWTSVFAGTFAVGDTLVVGATTYTFVASGATGNQLNTGSPEAVATQVRALTITGYNVGGTGANVTCEQATASSTETAPTFTLTSTGATITTTKTRTYGTATTPDFDCIALENIIIPAGETCSVQALFRGPAIVDFDNLGETNTPEAQIKAKLEAMQILTTGASEVTAYQET